MTEHESILYNLGRLADVIVAMFGKNCEACVHHLTALHHSLVTIRGTVTRRHPGPPFTGLLVKLLNQDETIESLVQQAIGQIGRHPATMQVNEKTRLVSLLEEHGIFRLKGAVEQVARTLGVTRFTVYNYLKKVRTEKNITQKKAEI
jgi:predicted transcriptional regulator YheO